MTRLILIGIALIFLSGCGNDVIDQMVHDLSNGYGARFEDGMLDGHRTCGYDAAYLHDSIVKLITKEQCILGKLSKSEIQARFPLVYFVALKYETRLGPDRRVVDGKCFRLQLGAIDFFRSPDGPESPTRERPSCAKFYTFFMVSEDDHVEILSVSPSRNIGNTISFQGKYFSYSATNSKILIWDAYMPDRNRPEKILEGRYKKSFAVITDNPFNYMPYATSEKVELVEALYAGAIYRLCWHVSECMIFIPDVLLPQSDSTKGKSRYPCSEGGLRFDRNKNYNCVTNSLKDSTI